MLAAGAGAFAVTRVGPADRGPARVHPRVTAEADPKWFEREAMPGHAIRELPTGRDVQEARRDLIGLSDTSLYISAYAFNDDESSRKMLELMCERRGKGVDVRLLLDGKGAMGFRRILGRARGCGIPVLFDTYTHRGISDMRFALHEKLVISDGKRLVLGGSGWGRQYVDFSRESTAWHDLDARVDGPAACWFHRKFLETWKRAVRDTLVAAADQGVGSGAAVAAGRALKDIALLPKKDPDCKEVVAGPSRVLPRFNNPFYDTSRPLEAAYLKAIRASQREIFLYAPYFVPGEGLVNALLDALKRDVKVTVVTNSRRSTDENAAVLAATYRVTKPLRKLGARILLWDRKGTMHRKAGLFDDSWAYVGSDNQDIRGQEYSSESIVFTDDPAFVAFMRREFELDSQPTILLDPKLEAAEEKAITFLQDVISVIAQDMF